jgi:dinuclear metal center YbgI/SA1388 family protein
MKRKPASARRRAVPLAELVDWLDRTLDLPAFADDASNNGLQVEGASRGVTKVACGVDASPAFYEEALRRGAQLLVVHHGISWGASLARIAGPNHRLVAPLVRADAALYAAHLPLDAHPTLGNNAQIAKALGLRGVRPFGTYRGHTIGVRGSFPRALPWEEAKARFRAICPGGRFDAVDAGRGTVRTVGIVSGGGADELEQASAAGLDAFLTGEFGLRHYNAALCDPIDLAAAGHYATERFGVRALGEALAERFGIDWTFVDLSLPW